MTGYKSLAKGSTSKTYQDHNQMGIHFLDRSPFLSGDGENIFINELGPGSSQDLHLLQKQAKLASSSTLKPTHVRLRSDGEQSQQQKKRSNPNRDLSNTGKFQQKLPEIIGEEPRFHEESSFRGIYYKENSRIDMNLKHELSMGHRPTPSTTASSINNSRNILTRARTLVPKT